MVEHSVGITGTSDERTVDGKIEVKELWKLLSGRFPGSMVAGPVHGYGIGNFRIEGVGDFVEFVELADDDSVDDDPFRTVYDLLEEIGVVAGTKVLRGSSSASGRFILLPAKVEIREVGLSARAN